MLVSASDPPTFRLVCLLQLTFGAGARCPQAYEQLMAFTVLRFRTRSMQTSSGQSARTAHCVSRTFQRRACSYRCSSRLAAATAPCCGWLEADSKLNSPCLDAPTGVGPAVSILAMVCMRAKSREALTEASDLAVCMHPHEAPYSTGAPICPPCGLSCLRVCCRAV